MDVASIQAELHRYYDKLIAGVCLIGMDESEPILFVNRGLLDMYHCSDEGEFYRLTGKVRKGMIEALITGPWIKPMMQGVRSSSPSAFGRLMAVTIGPSF